MSETGSQQFAPCVAPRSPGFERTDTPGSASGRVRHAVVRPWRMARVGPGNVKAGAQPLNAAKWVVAGLRVGVRSSTTVLPPGRFRGLPPVHRQGHQVGPVLEVPRMSDRFWPVRLPTVVSRIAPHLSSRASHRPRRPPVNATNSISATSASEIQHCSSSSRKAFG
jgi:hypothetical protein